MGCQCQIAQHGPGPLPGVPRGQPRGTNHVQQPPPDSADGAIGSIGRGIGAAAYLHLAGVVVGDQFTVDEARGGYYHSSSKTPASIISCSCC